MKEQRSPEGRAGGASRASRVVTRKGYAEERTGAERGKERERGRQNKQGGKENGGGRGTGQKGDRRKARTGAIVRRESGTARVCVFRRGFSPVAAPGLSVRKKGGVRNGRGAGATGREENGEGKSAAAIRERRDYRRTRPSLTLTKENRYA